MMNSLELAKELNCKTHKDLLRTIERLMLRGVGGDDIKESTFKNRMNREYKMYYLSDRVITMLETIYLFSGVKDGELKLEKELPNDGLVYFVTDGKKIKVGYTTNLKSRISSFQVGSSEFIEVLAVIENAGKKTESEIHEMFVKYRDSGEWFDLPETWMAEIQSMYPNVRYYLDLKSLIFELWHDSPDAETEIDISDFYTGTNYRIKRKLKSVIQYGINEGKSYHKILIEAKKEVNDLVDSLNFKPKKVIK